jgi:capsid protein
MPTSLEKQLERSRIKREIAENTLRTRTLAYRNENLKESRKRKLGWTVPGNPERDMTTQDRRRAMAMARQRVEENPLVAALMTARLDNIVGYSPRLRMNSKDNGWDATIEDWWTLEKDRLDIRGRATWGHLCRMWLARRDADGDTGVILVPNNTPGATQLSWVQTVEAEHIARSVNDTNDTGIELDEYGMPIRYFIIPDLKAENANPLEYPRENFVHIINDETYRASRVRGVSKFLQVFSLLQDHSDIIEGIVQKVKNESFIGLKFWLESSDGNPFGGGGQDQGEFDYSKTKMVPGMNLVLGEGEQAEVLESKSPHAEFDAFEKKLVSRIALPFGFTYELLTGDYAAINDRTARVMLKQFEKRIRAEQAAMAVPMSRIFRWALSRAVNANVFGPVPANIQATWFNHTWGFPGFPYINPLQEAQANEINLRNRTTSRIKIIGEQGSELFDDYVDEQKYEESIIAESGLQLLTGAMDASIATDQTNQPTV